MTTEEYNEVGWQGRTGRKGVIGQGGGDDSTKRNKKDLWGG